MVRMVWVRHWPDAPSHSLSASQRLAFAIESLHAAIATYWAATGPIHPIPIHRPPCSNGQARLRRSRLAASKSTRSTADVRIRASDLRGLPAGNPLFVNAAFAIHLNRRRDGSYRSCPLTTLDKRRVPKEQRERRSKVTPHMETIARDVRHAEDGADRSLPSPIPSVRGQRSAISDQPVYLPGAIGVDRNLWFLAPGS